MGLFAKDKRNMNVSEYDDGGSVMAKQEKSRCLTIDLLVRILAA